MHLLRKTAFGTPFQGSESQSLTYFLRKNRFMSCSGPSRAAEQSDQTGGGTANWVGPLHVQKEWPLQKNGHSYGKSLVERFSSSGSAVPCQAHQGQRRATLPLRHHQEHHHRHYRSPRMRISCVSVRPHSGS